MPDVIAAGRVADQDAEAVGALLDVGQQRQRHPLDPQPGPVVGHLVSDDVMPSSSADISRSTTTA